MSDAEKADHVSAIYTNDDIEIDPSKVAKNSAMRSLAKLFLNNAWGKFAQTQIESKIVSGNEEGSVIANFFADLMYEPLGNVQWRDGYMHISRKPSQEALRTAPFTNIVYGPLTKDTDSIVYLQRIGENPLAEMCGEGLGMLTDEILNGKCIDAIVALAPKVYALRYRSTMDGEYTYTIKPKGVTMNCRTSRGVRFDSMVQMVNKRLLTGACHPLTAYSFSLQQKSFIGPITTRRYKKIVRPMLDKGVFAETGELTPFGFTEDEADE